VSYLCTASGIGKLSLDLFKFNCFGRGGNELFNSFCVEVGMDLKSY